MSPTSSVSLKVILISAGLFFAIPFGCVLSVLGLYGLVHLFMTHDPQGTLATVQSIGASNTFAWFSHTIHMLIASIIGYHLAKRYGRAAILIIWLAVPLAMFVHMSIHVLSGVPVRDLLTQFEYVRLPFMVLGGAFLGFHGYFLRHFGLLVARP